MFNKNLIRALGPGLLFAALSVGVSYTAPENIISLSESALTTKLLAGFAFFAVPHGFDATGLLLFFGKFLVREV